MWLEHAHAQGIIHRDIEPANLLLDSSGHVWVTDFGLARLETGTGITMSGDVMGTLRYMSLEQAQGERHAVGPHSDIYSLDATLYELLTLQPVFPTDDRAKLVQQIAESEPRRLRSLDPRVPVDLETIVLKALQKSPADRYPSAQALADDLQRFLDQRPIQAKQPGLFTRAARWSGRETIRTRNLRLRRPFSQNHNGLKPNDLEKPPTELGVSGECAADSECLRAALDGTENIESLHYIASAWPHLQPHIRATIVTLIDAALSQQQLEGGQS